MRARLAFCLFLIKVVTVILPYSALFAASPPQILVASNEQITKAGPENKIKELLDLIKNKFGIEITNEYVRGIIFSPMKEGEPQFFDIESELDHPMIIQSFDCNLHRFDKKEREYLKDEIIHLSNHSRLYKASDKKI